jgi:importin subunit beta-1
MDYTSDHYNRDKVNVNVASFDALYSLFENAPPNTEPLLLKSLEIFYQKLEETNQDKDKLQLEGMQDLQSFLSVCLQTILNRIESPLDESVADNMVGIIINCFDARGDVYEEGFLLISALCSKFGKHMDTYSNRLGPYIFHALKERDSSDTIKNACGVISDLCTMVESENIINAFEEYVPLLHAIMVNRKIKRDAKLGAVTAIGDTYLVTKERFAPFLDETLKLFSSAAEQCVNVNPNDYDLIEYITKLQGALVESYT